MLLPGGSRDPSQAGSRSLEDSKEELRHSQAAGRRQQVENSAGVAAATWHNDNTCSNIDRGAPLVD